MTRIIFSPLALLILATGCDRLSDPPDAPARPLGPSRGYADTTYSYLALASDPDSDSLCYRFDWGDGDTSDWCPPSPSGQGSRLAHAWGEPGTYPVRAQAQDPDANLSPWSVPCSVAIADTHPVLWSWSEPWIEGSPIIVENAGEPLIYFSAGDDFCAVGLDGRTRATARGMVGEDFWPHPAFCRATGNIIVGNFEGELHAFNTDLERSWHWPGNRTERTVDGMPWGTAAVQGETLYVLRGELNDRLYCFIDLGTAACLINGFEFDDDVVNSEPVIDPDGNVLVCTDIGLVYKFSPGLDSLLWAEYVQEGEPFSMALGTDGSVYVLTYEGSLEALRPDGSYKWCAELGQDAEAVPVVGDSAVFVGTTCEGDFHSVSLADGNVVWSVRLETEPGRPDYASNSPVLTANGLVYVLGWDALHCLRQSDGELRWRIRLREPGVSGNVIEEMEGSPALAPGGNIIAPADDGVLYCIAGDPAATLAQTSWPKWQHDDHNTGFAGSQR